MTKTEKLQKEIDKLMRKAVGSSWFTYQTAQILKACKESGLEFVDSTYAIWGKREYKSSEPIEIE